MTGLTPEALKAQLRTLVSGRYKVLLKKPAEGYKPDHRISVNAAFTDAQLRVRLPAAMVVGGQVSEKEREKNQETVEEVSWSVVCGIVCLCCVVYCLPFVHSSNQENEGEEGRN